MNDPKVITTNGWAMLMALIGFGFAAGCRLDGTWSVVSVVPEPRGSSPVVSVISFSPDGRYAATELTAGQSVSSTGRYGWDGFRLKLLRHGGVERVFPCGFNWDFSLRIKNDSADDPWVAMLRRDE